ncbi:MAG TPA: dUTP diphosphatase [bacterium]|nr:dUTP diphosphatase [bacterium]
MVVIKVKRLAGYADGVGLPERQTEGSAGFDVRAANPEPLMLMPGGRAAVPTGLSLSIPPGHEVQVRPRSGLALKHGIILPNSPGTIDSDYRGELKVILMNLGDEPFMVRAGDRIAQLVVGKVAEAEWEEVAELDGTRRSEGGFGHTGK